MRQKVFRSAWKVAATAMLLAVAFGGQANALNDLVAQWTFENFPDASGTAVPTSGVVPENGANAGSSDASTNTGGTVNTVSGEGSINSYSSNGWNAGEYWQFHTSTTGLTGVGLQFDQVSSTTGPRDFIVQYSTNGTTFTDFATYSIQPNATPAWANAFPVAPAGLDTYNFNLTGITALNNAANIYLRLTTASPIVAAQFGSTPAATGTNRVDNVTIFNNFDPTQPPVVQPIAPPVAPIAGDVVMGLGSGRSKTTLDLVRGTLAPSGGAEPAPLAPWQANNFNFIQSPRFDNLGGTNHNVAGNLVGVDTGSTAANGGKIYSLGTQGGNYGAQQIANTVTGTGGAGLTATRFSGLGINGSNNRIAVGGFDSGKVVVYNYTAGNAQGTGASASAARETASAPLSVGFSQGTTWVNNTTALAFNINGDLTEVNEGTMATTLKTTLPGLGGDTSKNTALYYDSSVSPYIYALYGGFSSPSSNNQLFILDAAYNIVKQVNLSTSMDTAREIALDANGNIFISQNGSKIDYLDVVGVGGVAGLTDNSSQDWYTSSTFTNFNGLDIGRAAAGIAGDYNNDGKVNAQDYVLWRKSPGTYGGNPAGYNTWRANYGTGGLGSGSGLDGASVPEPASIVLVLIGLMGVGLRRRNG